ncbi:MAG: hypothetical protein ABI286_00575 [Edaphobacter sp.]
MKKMIAVVVFLFLCIPLPRTAAPDWSVRVVDGAGLPVEGMTVRESFRNYSTESQGHESDQITDSSGSAHFARVDAWNSMGRRLVGSLMSLVGGGVHASFGTHAFVFAFGKGLEGSPVRKGYLDDWIGSPSIYSSEIVVRPVEVPK